MRAPWALLALLLAAAVGVGIVNRGLPAGLPSWTSFIGLTRDPVCTVALADGGSVRVPLPRAARLVSAAAEGRKLAVRSTSGQRVAAAQVDLDRRAGVTCEYSPDPPPASAALGPLGLTDRAERVRDSVREAFGPLPDGGFAPGGVGTGHGATSAHYRGDAVDFFFRPHTDPSQRAAGWRVANYLVANAQRLGIAVLIFDDLIWSAGRSPEGWRPYVRRDGAKDPVNRHLDHVHMDVIAGQ